MYRFSHLAESRTGGFRTWSFYGEKRLECSCLCGESKDGAPVEARAKGCEDDRRCGWGRIGGVPLGCCDEKGGGGGVAITIDIAKETVFRDGEGRGYFADEVYVGLVHEEGADVCWLELIAREEVFDGAGNFSGSLDDDVEASHLDGASMLELEGIGVVAVGT